MTSNHGWTITHQLDNLRPCSSAFRLPVGQAIFTDNYRAVLLRNAGPITVQLFNVKTTL